jgi:hypothetical protein
MAAAEETVMLKVEDRDPLIVNKQRLVENSPVFAKLFVELCLKEHDMIDFTTEIVEMFLTLLEDGAVGEIREEDFFYLKLFKYYSELYNDIESRL